MTDKKPRPQEAAAPSDDEIAEAAARLSAKWGRPTAAKAADGKDAGNGTGAGTGNGTTSGAAEHRRTEPAGPVVQTLEKGRTHMVTVEVRRSRRIRGREPTTEA